MSDLSSVLAPETAKRKTWRLRNRPALSKGSDGVAWVMVVLVLTLTLLFMPAVHGGEVKFDFDIPPSTADKALVLFAKQANTQLLFSYEDVSTLELRGLVGRYTVKNGIKTLIADTCLEATVNNETKVSLKLSEQKKGFWFMTHSNCNRQVTNPVALSAIALAISATSVTAQTPASDRSYALEEIIVTAQRREQNLQDVPISITAITGEQLQLRGIDGLAGLNAIAPNVMFRSQPGQRLTSTISIRGVVAANSSALWSEPAVGLYVDGVYLGKSTGSVFDLLDIERVEVLRGPQGTLFGRNTEAGAINFITRKPSGEFHGSAGVEYGNFGHKAGKINIDLPRLGIASASLGVRKEEQDGWAKNRTGPDLGAVDNEAARLALKLDPSDDFAAIYTFDYTKIDNTPLPASLYALSGWRGTFPTIFGAFLGTAIEDALDPYVRTSRPKRVSTNHPEFHETVDTKAHSLTLSYQINEEDSLKYIFAKRKFTYKTDQDQDGSPLTTITLTPTMTWGLTAQGDRTTFYDQRSHELQWVGSRERLNHVLGLYYFKDDGATYTFQNFALFGLPYQNADFATGTVSKAVFGQIDYQITDRWEATVGIRYTKEKKDGWTHRYRTDGFKGPFLSDTVAGMLPRTAYDKSFSSTTPMAAISYEWSDNLNVYARIAKGFKSGGFSSEIAVPQVTTPFKPESSLSTEVGIKSTFLDGRARINFSVYHTELTDQQTAQIVTGTTQNMIVNAGESTYQGAELEALLRVADGWSFQLGYGYLDAKYDKFIDNAFLPPLVADGPVGTGGPLHDTASNRRPPYAPEHTLNLTLDGRLFNAPWGELRMILDASYVAKTYLYPVNKSLTAANAGGANLVGVDEIPALKNLNARLQFSGLSVGPGELEVSLWCKNLTNEDKPIQGIDFSMFRSMFWQEPRTYMITGTYKW